MNNKFTEKLLTTIKSALNNELQLFITLKTPKK